MTKADESKVVDQVRYLRQVLPKIEESYRWLNGVGFERSRSGGEVGGRSKPAPDAAVAGVVANPSRDKMRAEVREAAKAIRRSASAAVDALHALDRAALLLDDATPHVLDDDSTHPVQITKGEMRRAEQAKERRSRRGEGWGNG